MQTSGNSCREIADTHSPVIVREGGRSSIPEAAVTEPISRGVLDPRLRGDDKRGGVSRSAREVEKPHASEEPS